MALSRIPANEPGATYNKATLCDVLNRLKASSKNLSVLYSTSASGTLEEFPISVGVYQGSALSLLFFIVVMNAISRGLLRVLPLDAIACR